MKKKLNNEKVNQKTELINDIWCKVFYTGTVEIGIANYSNKLLIRRYGSQNTYFVIDYTNLITETIKIPE